MIEISRRYRFTVRHSDELGQRVEHDCRLTICLATDIVPDDGVVVEFGALDKMVAPIIALVRDVSLETLTKRCSTRAAADVSAQPTVERLVEWFAFRLALLASARPGHKIMLSRLTLYEDDAWGATWTPPGRWSWRSSDRSLIALGPTADRERVA